MKNVIVILVIGFILFEVLEHVVFPLFWSIKNRNKKPVSGATGMLGKVAEVKRWHKGEGQVSLNGELWRAISDVPLFAGDKAVVQELEGLTLRVKPLKND
jgi:membrane-bound ClpP family serine protease